MAADSEKPGLLERLSHFLLREPEDREQLVELLHSAYENNLMDADSLAMIEGVLQVSEMQVRDIMIPRSQMTTGDARKRIDAMKQYTALVSGFKIAMRDLEIRGAGNLLGTQQSGHIIAVGFEMYCQMLKSAVNKHQGKRATGRVETVMAIDFVAFNEAAWLEARDKKLPAFIPATYITEPTQRIPAYRQIAEVASLKELVDLTRQWRDRYGRPPHSVENLQRCTELKLLAHNKGISTVEIKDHKLMLSKNGEFILIGGKFPRLREKAAPLHRLEEAITLLKQL